jgi:hypothetical protein
MFQTKVEEKIKTRTLYSKTMWQNTTGPDSPETAILYGAEKMLSACRIPKARTQTQAHYVQYVSLTAARNILKLDITCKGNPLFHFHGNTAHFTLFTATSTPKTKMEVIVAFP